MEGILKCSGIGGALPLNVQKARSKFLEEMVAFGQHEFSVSDGYMLPRGVHVARKTESKRQQKGSWQGHEHQLMDCRL